MAKILVIRLSAIGDVAMTIPVVYSAAKANPDDSFTVLTQAFLMPVFMNRPSNVEVIGINTQGSEKSLKGLLRFAWAFSKYDYDTVLDLHNVLRTIIIRTLFRLRGKNIFILNKARKERKQLTARTNKKLKPLRPVIDRYADVFIKAGLNYVDSFQSLFEVKKASCLLLKDLTGEKVGKWIGIAPFAKHRGKIYPVEEMEKVISALTKHEINTIFLLGGKGEEEVIIQGWASKYPQVKSVVGRYSLDSELALISKLDILLCMDSANMHFASLVGTRVLSVWGATHPYAGFYGYHQQLSDAIQIKLSCRPCSVFGEKPCFRGDWACLTQLSPEQIVCKVNDALAG